MCSFLNSLVTSSLLEANIPLSTLFSNTLSLCFSLNVSDQVPHPSKSTGRIIVLYTLIFKFLDSRQEDCGLARTYISLSVTVSYTCIVACCVVVCSFLTAVCLYYDVKCILAFLRATYGDWERETDRAQQFFFIFSAVLKPQRNRSSLTFCHQSVWFSSQVQCLVTQHCNSAGYGGGRIWYNRASYNLNPLNTKRRLLYLKTQFVPRSKHFSSRL